MSDMEKALQDAQQLMCEHRFARGAQEGEEPICVTCGLGYRDYVRGTVRAALTRQGVWD